MTPKPTSMVLSLGLAAWVGGCGTSSHIAKEADRGIALPQLESVIELKPDNPVHTIVLPHDEPVFPPGPGREVFVTACVVCHSPRYITMQPPFSRTAWKGEVNKMKDVYGAHISDEQVPTITDYLVSINGTTGGAQPQRGARYGE
jgi:mono/diheme cytochrome c family protein